MTLDFEICCRAVAARAPRFDGRFFTAVTSTGVYTGPHGTGPHGTGPHGTWLSLRLACREPFDGESMLGFLATRAIPGVERVTDGRYARTIRTPAGAGVIELIPGPPGQGHVLLRVRLAGLGGVGRVVSRCRQLFDLEADPAAIGSALASDRVLPPRVHARPGLRIPGVYGGFELAVRAVLGQQVSVSAGRTFAARLAAQHGSPLAAPDDDQPAMPTLLFPGPEQDADADLSRVGLTTARQATLRALAGVMATGRLDLDPGTDPAEAAARLSELPGIGPWTVSYILIRSNDVCARVRRNRGHGPGHTDRPAQLAGPRWSLGGRRIHRRPG